MLMIRPLDRAIMVSRTARQHTMVPLRLTAISRSQVSSVLRTNGSMTSMPALLTSTSISPSSSTTCWKAARTAELSDTSTPTPIARAPNFSPTSPAAAAAAAPSRSAIATAAPCSARPAAMAAPMPRAAPVTTQTRPSSEPMVSDSLLVGGTGGPSAAGGRPEHPAGDLHLQDLAGPLDHPGDPQVAEPVLERHLLGHTERPEPLHHPVDDREGRLRAMQLGHRRLGAGVATPAVGPRRVRHGETHQAQLTAERGPDRGVVAGVRGHQAARLGLRRPPGQEAAHDRAEVLLLVAHRGLRSVEFCRPYGYIIHRIDRSVRYERTSGCACPGRRRSPPARPGRRWPARPARPRAAAPPRSPT